MTPSLLVVVPVLRRPHRAQAVADSIAKATPEPHRILFVCSPGDEPEIAACRATGHDVAVMDATYEGHGDYARKINHAVTLSDEELIFTGADDLAFHSRWFAHASARLRPGIGVVGTNDLGNPRVMSGHHSTHSLVTRAYVERYGTIDEPGKVYHEGYPHEFCDDEMVETARMRGAFVHARNAVVEHLHPHWGKADTDPLYDRAEERLAAGRVLFLERRALWRGSSVNRAKRHSPRG